MSKANVIFTLDGIDLPIQCNENDIMKDICQKYSNKIKRSINSLVFLYGGSQLKFNLKFKEAINDKESNDMKVLVYSNENEQGYICSRCGENIKLNKEIIDNIILSINNLKETIDSAKLMLENVIKISSVNDVNIQIKGVNIILNTLNDNIIKIKEKVKNLLNGNKNNENNYILADVIIKENDVGKDIRIINSYEECLRNDPKKYLKDEIFKNEDEIKKCEIYINDKLIQFNYFYKFKSKGKYKIKYLFKNQLKNICLLFQGCSSLTSFDLSNFYSNNITNINGMFSGCSSLNDINLSNFNTNKVTNMNSMFRGCSSLSNINISTFNTDNVNNMGGMFHGCSSLTNINLSNFNTANVSNMGSMFYGCSSLNDINLSNFNTKNLNDMGSMFSGCSSLKNIKLSNFDTHNVANMRSMFSGCSSLTDINLSNFNTDNVTNMNSMFYKCSSLTHINISNFNTNNTTNIASMFGRCKSLNKNNIFIKNKKILDDGNLFKE